MSNAPSGTTSDDLKRRKKTAINICPELLSDFGAVARAVLVCILL
jgi:hypothetical protein